MIFLAFSKEDEGSVPRHLLAYSCRNSTGTKISYFTVPGNRVVPNIEPCHNVQRHVTGLNLQIICSSRLPDCLLGEQLSRIRVP